MILNIGSSPYNNGKSSVSYGAITPTSYSNYDSFGVVSVTGVNNLLNRFARNEFVATGVATSEIFNNTSGNYGLITELLVANIGTATARIYINEQTVFNTDSAGGTTGGFSLASGESIQIQKPVTHIGQVGSASVLYHGTRNYNYNTI